jgi:hypothetical protein
MEQQKDIIGYEGLYRATMDGMIYSLITNKNLKPATDSCGYQTVTLVKDKKKSTKTVHRLIAKAFYGDSKLDVNHKDGNKKNNQLNNLEFISKSQNTRHALAHGLFVPNTIEIALKKRKVVIQRDVNTNEIIKKYISAHQAARETGFNRGNISTCCRQNKIMYNYKWQYEN